MIILKIQVFLKSLFFHIWSGLPKSTQAEINQRFFICRECSEFNSIKMECSICGCNINTKKRFLNKLAWADQECPIGKWKKREQNNDNQNK